uniref:Uncharacterized protein n=1 Tax=Arundo donax TaxID=35708 RepID=A0A0A9B276_ARUDO
MYSLHPIYKTRMYSKIQTFKLLTTLFVPIFKGFWV